MTLPEAATVFPKLMTQSEFVQVMPLVHVLLHAPQFVLLLVVSTHELPHAVSGGAQHEELTHVAPLAHAIPQPPQLPLSRVVSTHALVVLQYVDALCGQDGTQLVPLHATVPPVGAAHCVQLGPHAVESLATQRPEHTWLGLGHTHPPFMHASPAGQTLPQAPQLAPSLISSTQPPAQGV